MTLGRACSFPKPLFSSVNMGQGSYPGTQLRERVLTHTECLGVEECITHKGALGAKTEGSILPFQAFF